VVTREAWEDKFGLWYVPEPNTGCWLWMLSTDAYGYGQKFSGTQNKKAHRLSYEFSRGPIPSHLELDHLCRVRSCVNPDHLEAVTRQTNATRGVGWAGRHFRTTHCPHGHEYTDANTRVCGGKRFCRECARLHKRAYAWARAIGVM